MARAGSKKRKRAREKKVVTARKADRALLHAADKALSHKPLDIVTARTAIGLGNDMVEATIRFTVKGLVRAKKTMPSELRTKLLAVHELTYILPSKGKFGHVEVSVKSIRHTGLLEPWMADSMATVIGILQECLTLRPTDRAPVGDVIHERLPPRSWLLLLCPADRVSMGVAATTFVDECADLSREGVL